jgi:hypothetical protein
MMDVNAARSSDSAELSASEHNPVLALAGLGVLLHQQRRGDAVEPSADATPSDPFRPPPGKRAHDDHPFFKYYGLLTHQQVRVRCLSLGRGVAALTFSDSNSLDGRTHPLAAAATTVVLVAVCFRLTTSCPT